MSLAEPWASRVAASYINVASETQRREHMERLIANAGLPFPVHRFDASTPDSLRILTRDLAPSPRHYGAVACYDSHLRLMIQFLADTQQADVLLVFEDDIDWNGEDANPQDFIQALRAFVASPAEAMWFGAWGSGHWHKHRTIVLDMPQHLAVSNVPSACMHALALRRSAVQAFVTAVEKDVRRLQDPVDSALVSVLRGRRVLALAEPVSADRKFRGLFRQRREDFPTSIPSSAI